MIWFDAHGDFNERRDLGLGYLDGMGIAILVGDAWQGLAAAGPRDFQLAVTMDRRRPYVVGWPSIRARSGARCSALGALPALALAIGDAEMPPEPRWLVMDSREFRGPRRARATCRSGDPDAIDRRSSRSAGEIRPPEPGRAGATCCTDDRGGARRRCRASDPRSRSPGSTRCIYYAPTIVAVHRLESSRRRSSPVALG